MQILFFFFFYKTKANKHKPGVIIDSAFDFCVFPRFRATFLSTHYR